MHDYIMLHIYNTWAKWTALIWKEDGIRAVRRLTLLRATFCQASVASTPRAGVWSPDFSIAVGLTVAGSTLSTAHWTALSFRSEDYPTRAVGCYSTGFLKAADSTIATFTVGAAVEIPLITVGE